MGLTEDSQTGYYVAGSVGAEYLISKHFSVGGEIQMRYEKLNGDEATLSPSHSSTGTRTLVLLRWYF